MILNPDKTYQHVLADQDDEYDRIWSSILSTAYNSYQSTSKILSEQWVWSGERTDLYLITDHHISGEIYLNDTIKLEPIVSPFINHTYHLTLWPKLGYNTLTFHGEQLQFYAHSPNDWPLVRSQELFRAITMMPQSYVTNAYESKEVYEPLIGIFLLFLGLGMLWLEERLYP